MATREHPAQDATPITRAKNRAVLDTLPFDDVQDFEDARRGFMGSLPEVEIKNAQGRVVWSLRDYAFLAEETAPPTVNPSLWRQARLNMHHGLFQVTERVYQIRGFDISNMTLIEGDAGVVVIDPLISTEVARAGLELYRKHRGARPVTAVIYSHSHTDHYGGVRGVVEEDDVRRGRVDVWADAVIARAREDFARGEYRFVAEALSHVVFADPANVEARRLGADALEQLGYATESATWRNAYLLGALELRQGAASTAARAPVSPDVVRAMSFDLFFDYLGVRLNGEKAEGRRLVINWVFADLDRRYVLNLEHCALTYLADRQSDGADATVTLDRAALNRLVLRELTFADAVDRGVIRITGDPAKVIELFDLLDDFTLTFDVVEPRRPRS